MAGGGWLLVVSSLLVGSACAVDYTRIDSLDERVPLAIALIGGGVLATFFGYVLFHVNLFLIVGAAAFVVSFEALNVVLDGDWQLYLICSVCAVVGGMLAVKFSELGVILVGMCTGAMLGYASYVALLHFVSASMADHHHILLYVLVGVAGMVGCGVGLHASRVVLIIATSLVGAFCVACGVDVLTDRQLTVSNVEHRQLNALGWALLGAWLVLAFVGVRHQKNATRHVVPHRTDMRAHLLGDDREPMISTV